MHYIIAHRVNGKLVLAINSKSKDFIGSENFDEVLDYLSTSASKHPNYSPAILKFKSLFHIDNSLESKMIHNAHHFTGTLYYVELKKTFKPDVVKYVEVTSGRYGKLGYAMDQK